MRSEAAFAELCRRTGRDPATGAFLPAAVASEPLPAGHPAVAGVDTRERAAPPAPPPWLALRPDRRFAGRLGPEATIQAAIVAEIEGLAAAGVPLLVAALCNGVPLAGRKGVMGSARQRAIGMTPGITDLIVMWPDKRVGFAEVKVPGEELEPHQELFALLCRAWGLPHATWRSAGEVRPTLRAWGALG